MIGFSSFPLFDKATAAALSNDPCDNIILKNGEEISAKIIEITPDLIKYKKCGKLDGPLISIYKDEVVMLRYNDGSKDIFSSSEKKEKKRSVITERREVPWGGIFSLFFSTIGLLLGVSGWPNTIPGLFVIGSIAIIFGSLSLKERYWGFALAGMILGTVQFLLGYSY